MIFNRTRSTFFSSSRASYEWWWWCFCFFTFSLSLSPRSTFKTLIAVKSSVTTPRWDGEGAREHKQLWSGARGDFSESLFFPPVSVSLSSWHGMEKRITLNTRRVVEKKKKMYIGRRSWRAKENKPECEGTALRWASKARASVRRGKGKSHEKNDLWRETEEIHLYTQFEAEKIGPREFVGNEIECEGGRSPRFKTTTGLREKKCERLNLRFHYIRAELSELENWWNCVFLEKQLAMLENFSGVKLGTVDQSSRELSLLECRQRRLTWSSERYYSLARAPVNNVLMLKLTRLKLKMKKFEVSRLCVCQVSTLCCVVSSSIRPSTFLNSR